MIEKVILKILVEFSLIKLTVPEVRSPIQERSRDDMEERDSTNIPDIDWADCSRGDPEESLYLYTN